jgi:hypothetical protein
MPTIKKLAIGGLLLGFVVLLAGCDSEANRDERGKVNQQQRIYVQNQPAPMFDWSLERHIMIQLYKARNEAVVTYSYVRNWQGEIVFNCKSIGFPLPSNSQLTNPEALAVDGYRDSATLPQAEPNGLYSSPSTSGTFVFCLNSDGTISPSYFEADVEAHLAPLTGDGRSLSKDSELKISPKK